jgi:hypothetical protein
MLALASNTWYFRAMSPLDLPWLVIENTVLPGEVITIQAGSEKYALVFTEATAANVFLAELEDQRLQLVTLATPVLKESYLHASSLLKATRVMFNYQRGHHHAQSAPLAGLIEYLKNQIAR